MEIPNRNFNLVTFILNGISNELNGIAADRETGGEHKKASKEFIDSLEEIEITEEDKTCSICLEDFKIGDKCIQLPCKDHKHLFHNEKDNCMGIKKWLQRSNTCPVCRTEFPSENINNDNNNDNNNEIVNEEIDINLNEIDNRMREIMGQILNNNIRVLTPQEIIEMEEQRQFEAAIRASLEEQ